MLACKLYEQSRREAAAIKIQKSFRCFVAWKSYSTLRHSAITLQTGMRAMVARDEFRFRKQTKASIEIQACFRCHRDYAYYRSLQRASLIMRDLWP
nr:myosin-17-like isoform X2 [Ipomoea trifida]